MIRTAHRKKETKKATTLSKTKLEKLVTATRKEWKETAKNLTSLTSFGTIYENGRVYHEKVGPCHIRLRRMAEYGTKEGGFIPYVVIDTLHRWKKFVKDGFGTVEDVDMYLNFMFNKSPWKKCFRTRSGKVAREKGVVCAVDVPANLLASSLMQLRQIWERSNTIQEWVKLVKCGVNPSLAIWVAHCISYPQANKIRLSNNDTGHVATNHGSMSVADVKMFVTGGYNTTEANPTFKSRFDYRNVHDLWWCGYTHEKAAGFLMDRLNKDSTYKYEDWGEKPVQKPCFSSTEALAAELVRVQSEMFGVE